MNAIIYARFILILTFILLSGTLLAQMYSVGRIAINLVDEQRTGGTSIASAPTWPQTGRVIGTEVYYPATTDGVSAPMPTGVFPIVVLAHGFVMTPDAYDNIARRLAQEGFITILPATETSFSPDHLSFAEDIRFLALRFYDHNTLSTIPSLSFLNGHISPLVAIGGHSMGAGCSMVAAQNNTSIEALFNFATATSNTTGISSLAGAPLVTVPTLIFSGERDCITDTTVQLSHYNSLASATKFTLVFTDLTHCDFGTASSVACVFGQNSSGCASTVSATNSLDRYIPYLLSFLKRALYLDCNAGSAFMQSIASPASTIKSVYSNGSIVCWPNSLSNTSSTSSVLRLVSQGIYQIAGTPLWQLYDMSGRMLLESSHSQIDLTALPRGVYFIRYQSDSRSYSIKLVH